MSTSVQPVSLPRKSEPSTRSACHWAREASRLTGKRAGYLEKSVYGADPIHNRFRFILRACIQTSDHRTAGRLLEGIEEELIDCTVVELVRMGYRIRALRLALTPAQD